MSDIEEAIDNGIKAGQARYAKSTLPKETLIAFTVWDMLARNGELMKLIEARVAKGWK